MEREIELYNADQRFCDSADAILKMLVEKQFNVGESLYILKKAKRAINASVQYAAWGEPLVCGAAPNDAHVWNINEVIAEINCRKDQDVS